MVATQFVSSVMSASNHPSHLGLSHRRVTDLLSKSTILGSPGWLGGLYGFSARMGSPVKMGSDCPSLLMAETSNWYRCPGFRPLAVASGVLVVQAETHSPLSMSM